MTQRLRSRKPNMEGVNLLMTLLICYPEIGTVTFEPGKTEALRLSFALSKIPPQELCRDTARLIEESVISYHLLEGLPNGNTEISMEGQGGTAFFHVVLDMDTVCRGEISMIATLVREKFADVLICDKENALPADSDELLAREEAIDNMLGSVKVTRITDKMVGFREDGRVMVYNK